MFESEMSGGSATLQPHNFDSELSMMSDAPIALLRSRTSMVLLGREEDLAGIDQGKVKSDTPPIRVELSEGALLGLDSPGYGDILSDECVRWDTVVPGVDLAAAMALNQEVTRL